MESDSDASGPSSPAPAAQPSSPDAVAEPRSPSSPGNGDEEQVETPAEPEKGDDSDADSSDAESDANDEPLGQPSAKVAADGQVSSAEESEPEASPAGELDTSDAPGQQKEADTTKELDTSAEADTSKEEGASKEADTSKVSEDDEPAGMETSKNEAEESDSDAEEQAADGGSQRKPADEEDDEVEREPQAARSGDESDNESNHSSDSDDAPKPSTSAKSKLDKLKEAEDIFGDSESEDEEFEGFKKPAAEPAKDDDDSDDDDFPSKKRKNVINDSDSDDAEKPFGGDDDEKSDGEAAAGKEGAEEGEKADDDDKVLPDISSSSEDEDVDRSRKAGDELVYDFDIMMAKRKEANARNRKRKNTDIINDSDDVIADLITQMKQGAEDDFELNKDRKAATRKMKLLPMVTTQLRKIDLREAFLDAGVLSVITDWLTPLPDRSLPNLQVRETLLKILLEFNIMDVDRLRASGIGKAVMYLFKHPKETKDNKRRAGQLISNWSRPIFNCETDHHSISKEDREQRDFDHMNKVSKRMRTEEASVTPRKEEEPATPAATLRPGDKGWVPRARVPQPSTRDYVVRPKSAVEMEMSRPSSKKTVSRLDKHLRHFQERKRAQNAQRAVKISIEGRKL